MPDITEYPEHEKLISVAGKSQMLDEFLAWLSRARAIELCFAWREQGERTWLPLVEWDKSLNRDQLIAEFLGVNWDEYKAEQEALLEEAGPAPDWQP